MKSKTRKYLEAALPAILMCSPALASATRTISRFKGASVAVNSGISGGSELLNDEKELPSDPFSVFSSTVGVSNNVIDNRELDVLDFLRKNDLLQENGEEVSDVSGDLGRKEFAHISPFSHCHAYGTTWNIVDYPSTNATQCASIYGGTWEPGTSAPFFENISVSSKTATSFNVDVDLNQSSTVYAVLVLSTAQIPDSTQVKNGVDGSGAAAIQTKTLAVNSGAFTGTISFSGLSSSTKYLVYLVGENGASALTPSPDTVNPGFDSGLIFSFPSSWKFPKVRTDSNGDFYVMYWNKNTTKIQFDKWNGSSWNHYASFGAGDISGREYVSYGNEYGANFEFDSTDNINIIFRASITNYANTSDPFHGIFNGTNWSFNQIIEDSNYARDIRMFIDGSDKIHTVYHVGYVLKYRTNAGGSWTGQDIITAGQIIAPGTSSGTDEIHDAHVVADSTGEVTIVYRREYGQNNSEDNYFMTSSSDSFTTQTLVLDGKGEEKYYLMGNVIVDGSDNIHYVYSNMTNSTGHYRTNSSGSWVTSQLTSPNYTITEGLGIQIDGTTAYILANSNNGLFFQGKENAGSWVDGNIFSLNGWFSDTFGFDTVSNRIMIVSENSSDWTASYHTGDIRDYIILGDLITVPNLGGTFTTNGTVDDNNTFDTLFSGVTVSDPDGDNVSVSITYTAGNGTLTGSGLTGSAGNYTLTSASPVTVQANLQGLIFHPTVNQVVPGNTVITLFTLTPNDGTDNGTANATTQLTVTSINDIPINTVAPAISGVKEVGNQLSATSGTWTDSDGNTPGFAYQWYRADDNSGSNEELIPLATSSNYMLTTSDAHKYLGVVVTADDGNGSNDQISNSTRVKIISSTPINTVLPVISGTALVYNTLYCSTGTWTDIDDDLLVYTYQWKANGTGIVGENYPSYIIRPEEAHLNITCTISANDGNGKIGNATTNVTLVDNSSPGFTGTPTIVGNAKVGRILNLTYLETSDADSDTVTLSYQWRVNGIDIANATLPTYEVTDQDYRKEITCIVTGEDSNGGISSLSADTWFLQTGHLVFTI